ncbi:UDP-glucuronic acid decarboxylase family protein [Achromobacter dolens]|uniref:UDP-glucuronic acid decarboxylase family protein n=1 Tax=Achromobacter dolens TaxID=1287738 RepID=UPI0006C5CAE8|nr:UDP-glucuronic acid decarboxylase family protein [Achromobacter dolens]CUJ49273.1 dTDP-glucose 4%2C6-dehydratase [Achromobacter dolens]
MTTTTLPKGRALVAGGAGFLGSNLCARLLADGWEVVCVDNFQTGRSRNLASLAAHPRLAIVRHDIVDPLRNLTRVDRIYNLACPASPVHYQADPLKTLRTCVLGSMQLLELGRRCGARVLQASTSEVYGDPLEHPQREGYWGHVNPVGPRSCYDEGKRCAETIFMEYAAREGVDVRIARIFNTYGPRMAPDDGRVVSNFIVQALAGQPLTIYGDGTQTRSFCYVDDLIDGLVRLMESAPPDLRPVNLGNPAELTMLEIADMVRTLTGADVPLEHQGLPVDDPAHRCPDISLARDRLGWSPRIDPLEGMERTVAYFSTETGMARRLPRPRRSFAASAQGPITLRSLS